MTTHEEEDHLVADIAERSNRDEDAPCVVDGVPIQPDPSVRAVCRALQVEGPKAATAVWKELINSRTLYARSNEDWIRLAWDTVVVAQTFERMAQTAGAEQSAELHKHARQLAAFAERYLEKVEGKETAAAISRVRSALLTIGDSRAD